MIDGIAKDWLPYPWQLTIWESLIEKFQNERMPHALLITGEQGSGKSALVNGLAKKILCDASTEFACGECKACLLFMAGSHPDFKYVGLEEKSKLIKVDQIREIIDFIGKTAQLNGHKIVIIDPAELMNINSANALLKCLEEPSPNSLIILLSHASHRLLPTIRSRCQIINTPKPTLAESDKWLRTFVQDQNQRQQLLMLANGNPLLAWQYTEKEVVKHYGEMVEKLIAIKDGSGSFLKQSETLDSLDIFVWLSINQKILWQMIQISLGVDANTIPRFYEMELVAKKSGFVKRAYKMLEEIQQAINEVQGPSNPNLPLIIESLLIRWQALLRS